MTFLISFFLVHPQSALWIEQATLATDVFDPAEG